MSIIYKVVRLSVLDDDGGTVANATGTIINAGKPYLFVCWHTVTGLNFFEPKITAAYWPPKRRKIRVDYTKFTQGVVNGQPTSAYGMQPDHLEISLYNEQLLPRWVQEKDCRPNSDLDAVGIAIPRNYDLVKLPISIDADSTKNIGIDWSALTATNIPVIGYPVQIVGYPYGYRIGSGPFRYPVVLTRFVASYTVPSAISFGALPGLPNLTDPIFFLDGSTAPGMSGAPIFLDVGANKMTFMGVYTGCIFPDAELLENSNKNNAQNDRLAALGTVCPLSAIQKLLAA